MTGHNLDFSDKIKDFFSQENPEEMTFVEKVMGALRLKLDDYNSRNPGHKLSMGQVKEVYKRGINDGVRLEKPIGLWAMARLNLFLKYAKGSSVSYSYEKLDRDIIDTGAFYIDDGIREDILFSYEQIAEAKFDLENFSLDFNEDYSFVDLEEYAEADFPTVLKKNDIVTDESLKDEDLPEYQIKKEEDPQKVEKEEAKKKKKEDENLPKLKDSGNKYY